MKKLLWLDDVRNPSEMYWILNYSPIGNLVDVFWVKSYQEFVDWINVNGLPDGICFDHDLADEHYRKSMYDKDKHYNNYYTNGTFKEKTGYDCALWLTDYCIDNKVKLPKYSIQSMNPVGKENIDGLLKNYIKNFEL